MKIKFSAVILAGLLTLFAVHAWGGSLTDQLKASIDKVIKILEDPALKPDDKVKERRAAIRRVADEIFDFAESAKRSLGRHWQERTGEEREEFTKLFADLLERSYIAKIELYGGEKITYAGESLENDQAKVRTKILTKNGTYVLIEYKMLSRGNRWLIYDVSFDGISLIANYRSQFNKIIQTSSYHELVKKLKSKQEDYTSRRDADIFEDEKSVAVMATTVLISVLGRPAE